MNYPRIYSLSTVGIRKHYNQDYLFHEERTDFTGSNGVGKSIVSDLLQLIFISDPDLIEFGTEGMKDELRKSYTLPLSVSEAYAFLNIETSENAFITVGVCIPNKRTRKLKPFVITRDADTQKPLSELTFPPEQLLMHKDFIKDGRFLGLDDLIKYLRNSFTLYLSHYTDKEAKERYYSFLYQKEILPINLSIEKNLQAFAKIIQSFSKAKTLSITESRSLQDFLFEGKEKEYQDVFDQHKANLSNLIDDYRNTESFIQDTTQKQIALSALKQKDENQKSVHSHFLQQDVCYAYNQFQSAEAAAKIEKKEYDVLVEERSNLKTRVPRLQALKEKSELDVKTFKEEQVYFEQYKEAFKIFTQAVKELEQIDQAKAPNVLDPLHEIDLDPKDYPTEILVKRIVHFKPLFEAYGSVAGMKQKVTDQLLVIKEHRQKLDILIKEGEEVIQLISLNKKDSIFSQVIERGERLSSAQEAVLLTLKNVQWGKPLQASVGDRYVTTLDLLKEGNIEKESNGYWLKLGNLNQFVSPLDKEQLFADPGKMKQAFANKKQELEQAIKASQAELEELLKFEQGKSFESSKITLNYSLDQRLKDYTAFDELAKTGKLIHDLNKRVAVHEQAKSDAEEHMRMLAQHIPFQIGDISIEKLAGKLTKTLNEKEIRAKSISEKLIKESTRLESISKDLIPGKSRQLGEKDKETSAKKKVYIDKDIEAKRLCPSIVIPLDTASEVTETVLSEAKKNYDRTKENYKLEYKSIIARFEETKEQRNAEINEQSEEHFEFLLLERVLLGPKIRHIDQIAEALRDANRNRIKMAEAIHQTMLKIFSHTQNKYKEYQSIIRDLNTFFGERKISNRYYFQIKFKEHPRFKIDWIDRLQGQSHAVHKPGELPFGISVEAFIEDFFKEATGYRERIRLSDLLDPKTYFELEALLTDENNKEIPGSTGETYTAIVLLGIGRLSKVETSGRKGIKFIILEETASLDKTNFNTFPNIAGEFGYQIITMTPRPYGSDSEHGWYLHHLIPDVENTDVNCHPCSYFKTNNDWKDLQTYLEAIAR